MGLDLVVPVCKVGLVNWRKVVKGSPAVADRLGQVDSGGKANKHTNLMKMSCLLEKHMYMVCAFVGGGSDGGGRGHQCGEGGFDDGSSDAGGDIGGVLSEQADDEEDGTGFW